MITPYTAAILQLGTTQLCKGNSEMIIIACLAMSIITVWFLYNFYKLNKKTDELLRKYQNTIKFFGNGLTGPSIVVVPS